jgi:hypothetical protein
MTPKATFHYNLQVTLWFPFYKLITGAMWYEQYAILYDMENLCAKKLMYKAPPRELPGTKDAVAHGGCPTWRDLESLKAFSNLSNCANALPKYISYEHIYR